MILPVTVNTSLLPIETTEMFVTTLLLQHKKKKIKKNAIFRIQSRNMPQCDSISIVQ